MASNKYPRNHTYLELDEAISGYRTNSGSSRARGKVSDLNQDSKKFLIERLKNHLDYPHTIFQGSKSTMEITLLSDSMCKTLITITNVTSRIKLIDKLKRI